MSRARRIAGYPEGTRTRVPTHWHDVLDKTRTTVAVRPFRHAHAVPTLIIGGTDMITLGLDPHPDSHTVAALDENGAAIRSITVPNTLDGLSQLYRFALPFHERRWAVEGASNRFILPFVYELLGQGEVVHHIPPNLTSQYRARLSRKKSEEE